MLRKPFGILFLCGLAAFAPSAIFGQAAPLVPVLPADIARSADGLDTAGGRNREEVAAADAWYERHELSLGIDGNLPGNLRVFDDAGKLVPARVKLYFLQSGQVVSQATPNDDGDFQVVGLKPGAYSVVAAGPSGFAAQGIRVLPPPDRPEAPKANSIGRIRTVSLPGEGIMLNVMLISSGDVQAAFGLAAAANVGGMGAFTQQPPAGTAAATNATSNAPSGGGGAGGGSGGGGGDFGILPLLGLAGAGLALSQGSGNDGSGNNDTSSTPPSSPNGN